jgi:hypothetical protein
VGVRHGWTSSLENGSGIIKISVGAASTEQDFKDDWELTHEMAHLGLPSIPRAHHWFEEGLATYVEPWARVQIKNLSSEKVWGDFVRDMPQGQPAPGDRGLDNTHTWGRTYWGGALFCLVADVRIREKTGGKKGFQDALRAINKQGTVADDWDMEQVLKTGDAATGTTVLMELYREMKDKPSPVDLNDLWKRLGISVINGKVIFDDTAPLTAARRMIERGS